MVKTDNILKRLVASAADDVAAWLLESPVREVTMLPSTLPPLVETLDSALIFSVTLESGYKTILLIEFRGPGIESSLPFRMLAYSVRLTTIYPDISISSVAWYVDGAGVDDTGEHQNIDGEGHASLTWRYQVIRLWELDGEALLALNRPALAALIGQTRLRDPQPALRQAVKQIVTNTSGELQELLLIELLTLCTDKEVAAMARNIVRYDSYGMEESPIIQQWRAEGREEGLSKGREEGQLTLLLRLLTNRYGALSSEMTAQVKALTATQMLDLADALFDFSSLDELEQWLGQRGEQ